MSTAGINPGVVARAWQRYLVALREHPMRTRMITSGVLYVVGDGVAQFGIEGRCLDLAQTETDEKQRWDVSDDPLLRLTLQPMRTARLTFCRYLFTTEGADGVDGSMIFAPLGHLWLSRLETFKAGGRMKSKSSLTSS
jgi:protein Mpv17